MVRASAKGMSSNVMLGGCWAIKGLSFLSVVGFSDRFLKQSGERLELLAGEYQGCGRMRKHLDGALAISCSYSQSDNPRESSGDYTAMVRYESYK